VKTWDVIIVGGGIIGLSLARQLRKEDRSVLVVERGEPGGEASHAAAGMLADCGDEIPTVLQPLASASARLYPEFAREVEDESGAKVDLRNDGTILLTASAEAPPNALSVPLSKRELSEREPYLASGHSHAFLLPERTVDPRALTAAVWKACRHRGVDFSSGTQVDAIDVANGRATGVLTAKTRFAASTVVNCGGAWAGQFTPHPFPIRPVKGQMLAVAEPSRELLRHAVRAPEVYLVPRSDGRVLIGSTLEDRGYDKKTDPDVIHRMHRAALQLMPPLEGARILEAWSGLRPGTPDGLPILGATETRGYFVAAGHFRDGILLAPVTAAVMANLIAGEAPSFDLSPFAPGRF
jgi:glycine oxidase